jgi:hypothetical protein
MRIEVFKAHIKTADMHANRMRLAYSEIAYLLPLTDAEGLDYKVLADLEFFTNRFAKLQDHIGGRIFPVVLVLLGENIQGLSMLEQLHILAKRQIIPCVETWLLVRQSRNSLAHDYPTDPEVTVQHLNCVIEHSLWILDFWNELRMKLEGYLKQF